MKGINYAAVVVGAGPAGITCLGNLLARDLGRPILWVDDHFNGGRVNGSWREVPSNTKTQLFIDFAEAVKPLKNVVDTTPSPNAVDQLRSLDPSKGCQLSYAGDMLSMLTQGLLQTKGVHGIKGRVLNATMNGGDWTLEIAPNPSESPAPTQIAIADRLVLCTGSHPSERALPTGDAIPNLDLDTVLAPSKLSETISKTSPVTVGVIGASHSAILALLNLSELAMTSHPNLRIKWFTRHSLRYAEFMDGWILRDNTGLKGQAAEWARQNLEPETYPKSPVKNVLEVVAYDKHDEEKMLEAELKGADYVVQAIGFSRDPIPDLVDGQSGKSIVPVYDQLNGSFKNGKEDGETIKGLFGAGIAFPERVTDPRGNVESAVGFFKFMKYIKRVSPEWN